MFLFKNSIGHWAQLPSYPTPLSLRWICKAAVRAISNASPGLKFIDIWPRNSMSWSLPLKLWKLFHAINFGWTEDSSLAAGGDNQCLICRCRSTHILKTVKPKNLWNASAAVNMVSLWLPSPFRLWPLVKYLAYSTTSSPRNHYEWERVFDEKTVFVKFIR